MRPDDPDWGDLQFEDAESAEARKFIGENAFQWQRFLAAPGADLAALARADISALLLHSQGQVLATRIDGSLAGLFVLANLEWESSVLHRKMSALKHFILNRSVPAVDCVADHLIKRAVRHAAEQKREFLMCRTYTDDPTAIRALEQNGFVPVETVLNYVYDSHRELPPGVELRPTIIIRRADAADTDAIVDAAHASFESHVGRFHSDPQFGAREAVLIYEEWLRSSLHGYGDAVFVAESDAQIAGFSVWKNPSAEELAAGVRTAHYSIGGVAPKFQGQGVFRALTLAGMRLYHGQADLIEGPTNERNSGVQRAYAMLGWEMRDSQYTFHRWL